MDAMVPPASPPVHNYSIVVVTDILFDIFVIISYDTEITHLYEFHDRDRVQNAIL